MEVMGPAFLPRVCIECVNGADGVINNADECSAARDQRVPDTCIAGIEGSAPDFLKRGSETGTEGHRPRVRRVQLIGNRVVQSGFHAFRRRSGTAECAGHERGESEVSQSRRSTALLHAAYSHWGTNAAILEPIITISVPC